MTEADLDENLRGPPSPTEAIAPGYFGGDLVHAVGVTPPDLHACTWRSFSIPKIRRSIRTAPPATRQHETAGWLPRSRRGEENLHRVGGGALPAQAGRRVAGDPQERPLPPRRRYRPAARAGRQQDRFGDKRVERLAVISIVVATSPPASWRWVPGSCRCGGEKAGAVWHLAACPAPRGRASRRLRRLLPRRRRLRPRARPHRRRTWRRVGERRAAPWRTGDECDREGQATSSWWWSSRVGGASSWWSSGVMVIGSDRDDTGCGWALGKRKTWSRARRERSASPRRRAPRSGRARPQPDLHVLRGGFPDNCDERSGLARCLYVGRARNHEFGGCNVTFTAVAARGAWRHCPRPSRWRPRRC